MRTDKVYLVGFMGAGKSSVARALGARLGWRVQDIDELIESREHQSIATVFARDGEVYFRQREHEVLCGLVHERQLVVATGGGTFVGTDNRSIINNDGASIWLDVSFSQVLNRLRSDTTRPLATDHSRMQTLFETRRPAYALADFRVDASLTSIDEQTEQILEWIRIKTIRT